MNTVLFSVTLDAIFTNYFFKFETGLCNSSKIVHRKKYIENVQMKTLKQYCPNVYIFIFHIFHLSAVQIEILY